jgi:hypothetical protein
VTFRYFKQKTYIGMDHFKNPQGDPMKLILLILTVFPLIILLSCGDEPTSKKKSNILNCQTEDDVFNGVAYPGVCYSIDLNIVQQEDPEDTESKAMNAEEICAQFEGEVVSACTGSCDEQDVGFLVCEPELTTSSSSMSNEISSSM